MTTPVSEHYRAYAPAPFTRAERDAVTVLFGGLHWRVERVIQAVLENGGNRAEVLPIATREDLLTGRAGGGYRPVLSDELHDGQPGQFRQAQGGRARRRGDGPALRVPDGRRVWRVPVRTVPPELRARPPQLRAGRLPDVPARAGPACFSQAAMGDGLDLDAPDDARLPVGDLLHRSPPGSRVPGAAVRGGGRADRRRRQGQRRVSLRRVPRPPRHGPGRSLAWHLTTPYFTRALPRSTGSSRRSRWTACA